MGEVRVVLSCVKSFVESQPSLPQNYHLTPLLFVFFIADPNIIQPIKMSESESYYSDEYSYDEQDGKAQDQKEENKEPSKPAGMMEWILRGGALANGNLYSFMHLLYCQQYLV